MSQAAHPEVAIIGRPNVGKSTLFNRIVGRRQAIVGSQSGLTRDRHRGTASWGGREFLLVDTGGLEWQPEDEILEQIQRQALRAVSGAAVVLLVVDGKSGPAAVEGELARQLLRQGTTVLLVVNKCDSTAAVDVATADFQHLGITEVFGVSAEHGEGVADLLDRIVALLPAAVGEVEAAGALRVAVVGRPNVGKSSLVNALLGDDRVVVSDRPGTTRDAIDTALHRDDRDYVLIDTAGIRRTGKREGFVESVSIMIARRRMADADVALLVVDATVGLTRHDVSIAAEAGAAGCGLVVVVNKWDLIAGQPYPERAWLDELEKRMGRIGFAEFAFVSARTGHGVPELLGMADEVQERRTRRIATGQLNAFFEQMRRSGVQPPPGSPQLKYLTQVGVAPPTFVLFVGGRGSVPDGYQRYVENRLREAFDLRGTPMVLRFRRGGRRPADGDGEL